MGDNLYKIVNEAQRGNKESMMLVVEKFKLLIKKYSRKLNYDGSDTDLVISLIEIVRDIPTYKSEDMKKEECLVGYIYKSLIYKYIRLSKKYSKIYSTEMKLNEEITGNEINNNIEDRIIISKALNTLPNQQKYILKKIYIYGYKESEIARELHISRQAINKTKKKALDNLKKYLAA